jgi:hypothetical protein
MALYDRHDYQLEREELDSVPIPIDPETEYHVTGDNEFGIDYMPAGDGYSTQDIEKDPQVIDHWRFNAKSGAQVGEGESPLRTDLEYQHKLGF